MTQIAAFVSIVLCTAATNGYQITSYFEEQVTALTTDTDYDGETYTLWYTETEAVTVGTQTAVDIDPISATTVQPSSQTGAFVTVVSVLLSSGVGDDPATSTRTHYHVPVEYSGCPNEDDGLTILTAQLTLSNALTGHLAPTSTSTSWYSLVTNEPIIQAFMDPTAIDPIDFAKASYNAQPGDCARAISTVDYGPVCATAPAGSLPEWDIACGETNPCCWGCHGWANGVLETSPDYYICEDGRQLDLNGSQINTAVPTPTSGAEDPESTSPSGEEESQGGENGSETGDGDGAAGQGFAVDRYLLALAAVAAAVWHG